MSYSDRSHNDKPEETYGNGLLITQYSIGVMWINALKFQVRARVPVVGTMAAIAIIFPNPRLSWWVRLPCSSATANFLVSSKFFQNSSIIIDSPRWHFHKNAPHMYSLRMYPVYVGFYDPRVINQKNVIFRLKS